MPLSKPQRAQLAMILLFAAGSGLMTFASAIFIVDFAKGVGGLSVPLVALPILSAFMIWGLVHSIRNRATANSK